MRELLLLRHAKTEFSSQSGRDFDRELRRRGHNDSALAAQWIREQGCIPDAVVSSPARRAQQTAELVCRHLELDYAQVYWEPGIYEASPGELIRIAENYVRYARVMMVGHNPGFEMLARILATDAQFRNVPTAGVAYLSWGDAEARLEPHTATLKGFFRPSTVRNPD